MKNLKSVLALAFAVVTMLGTVACGGGQTGIRVLVDAPQTTSFRYPEDYDTVRVQAIMDDGETYGQTFQLTGLTQPPFTFLIVAGEKDYRKAKDLTVGLYKGAVMKRQQVEPEVVLVEGEFVTRSFDFQR